jgi:hypothetical protein
MLTDLLHKIKGTLGKKKTPEDEQAAKEQVNPSEQEASQGIDKSRTAKADTAKSSIDSEKKKQEKQDRIVLAVMCVVVIGGYYLYQGTRSYEDPNAESLIPMAQLTGRVGAQPRQDTLEQQFRRQNKNVPLSDGSAIPAETIAERTRLFRKIPFGDNELEYELRLPDTWGQSQFAQYGTSPGSEKYNVLTNIDRYFGPSIEDTRPFVWIEAERVKRQTWAKHYMDLFFIKRGITPESVKTYDHNKSEALYIDVRDYVTYAVRSQFVLNGDRMVVLTFAVPLHDYAHYRELMGLTMNSFKLLHPIERQPETVSQYKLLNILTFDYITRWLPRNENRSSSLNPSVELILPTELNLTGRYYGTNQQIEGLMLVHAWRNRDEFNRDVLEQAIVKRLAVAGIKLHEVLQSEKELAPREGISKITQSIYIGLIDQTQATTEEFGIVKGFDVFPRQEVWVTIFDNDDYTAAVTLITWPQTKNYAQWSVNVIGYQTIIDSLKMRKLAF